MGSLEEALAIVDRARERALDMTEQGRFQKIGRDGAGVDGYEGAVAAGAEPVDRPRRQFLARSGFSYQQDVGTGGRRPADQLEDLFEAAALADDLAHPLEPAPELHVFDLQRPLLGGAPHQVQDLFVFEGFRHVVEGAAPHRLDR